MNPADPFDTPEFRDFADRARTELVPKLANCAASVTLLPDDPAKADVKLAVELGFALLLGKPILLVAPPGAAVPPALRRAADRVAECDLNAPEGWGAVAAAVRDFAESLTTPPGGK